MANRIQWLPNTEDDIASYIVESGLGATGDFGPLITVIHDLDGDDYEDPFFVIIDSGSPATSWFRIIAVDTNDNESTPSPAFTVTIAQEPLLAETVALNENYGGMSALQIVDSASDPITEAVIRVYYTLDYEAGDLDAPVGVTTTDENGDWQQPIFVSPGQSYTIYVFKTQEFDPIAIEVVVPGA